MERSAMAEERLYDAAAKGDESELRGLLGNDPFLLDRVSYTSPNNTPLHVATMKGHLSFVQAILNSNSQLAEGLNSQQSSALHIASTQGHLQIAKELADVAPDMCLSRDCQSRNPLHLAAMKGHVQVLAELVQKAPLAAREKVDRGLTVLHLCVKHGQLEALKIMVQKLNEVINEENDDGNTMSMQELNELINAKNDDGDAILHMAVMRKQIKIIQYLVENTNIDVKAKNSNGQTSMAILEKSPPETKISEIREILNHGLRKSNTTDTQPVKWLTKKRDAIMVVAILIATMAFQAGVSPAGGVWQENSNGNLFTNPHKAGEAIMAHNHPKAYKQFMRSNTVAFVSSLSTILLLISGLPFRRRLFMWILMVIMWLTITSVAVTYSISVFVVTPKEDRKPLTHNIGISLVVWTCVMAILLVGNTLRLIDRSLKNRGVIVWRPRRFRNSVELVNYENARQETV